MSDLIGVHNRRLLPPKLERRKAHIRRAHEHPAPQQPHGQQDLDTRHLLPQWQEIGRPQHDNAQQAAKNPG